jgi:hypothetical protein
MCFSLQQADKIENTSKVIHTSVTSIQLMSTLRSILFVIAQRQRSNVSSIDVFGRGPLWGALTVSGYGDITKRS